MRTVLVGAVCSALLITTAPTPLRAHGRLKSYTPALVAHLGQVPSQLRLEFTETVELVAPTS